MNLDRDNFDGHHRRMGAKAGGLRTEMRPWTVAAGAAVAMGSLMPWATVTTGFGSANMAGTEGDGVITLALGAGAAVFGGFLKRWPAFALFALAAAVSIYDFSNISDRASEVSSEFARASVGWGLWLVIAGAIAGAILTLVGGVKDDDVRLPIIPPPPPRV